MDRMKWTVSVIASKIRWVISRQVLLATRVPSLETPCSRGVFSSKPGDVSPCPSFSAGKVVPSELFSAVMLDWKLSSLYDRNFPKSNWGVSRLFPPWECDRGRAELEDWPMTRDDRMFSEFIFQRDPR